MSAGFFVVTHSSIMNGITKSLGGQSDIYGDIIAPTMIGWMSLYIVISGYKAMAGKLQTPLPDVLWNLGISGILLAFVTNANGWFDMVQTAIESVGSSFSGSDTGIWGQLDQLWDKTQMLGDTLYMSDDSLVPLNGWTAKMLIWIGTCLVAFTGGLINLTTEATLKLLLVTGPLFLACLAWGWLRATFENWLKAILSCLITILLASLSLNIVLTLMQKTLDVANMNAAASNVITTAFMITGIGLLGSAILFLATKIATSLSGSAVAATASGMALAAAAGSAILAGNTVGKPLATAAKDAGGALAGYAGNKAMSTAERALNRYQMQQTLRKSSINNMARLNK